MHILIPSHERGDLPLVIKTTRDLSKLPVGPMNLDWIGFTPAGYNPDPPQKPLPRDMAGRLLKEWHDWVTGHREPVYTPVEAKKAEGE